MFNSNINKHLAFESILADCLHGFRNQRSCKTQLVQFFHDLVSNLDRALNRNHRQTDVIIMDFAKAFDKVPHRRLLSIVQIRLLRDKRIYSQVDHFMALWALSSSSMQHLFGIPIMKLRLDRWRRYRGQLPGGPAGDGETPVASATCLTILSGHPWRPAGSSLP